MLQHCFSSIIAGNKAASQTTPTAQGLVSHSRSAGKLWVLLIKFRFETLILLGSAVLENSAQFFSWGVVGVLEVSVCMPSLFSCVQLFGTPWTVARQDPLSMGFAREEHRSRLLFPSLHVQSTGLLFKRRHWLPQRTARHKLVL